MFTWNFESNIVRNVARAERSSLPEEASNFDTLGFAPGEREIERYPDVVTTVNTSANNYFMMVLRSFFIVLPVSMISSTIRTFFPAKFSRLSKPTSEGHG